MNHDDVPLENRIAAALAATDITSSDLSQLFVEADAAITAADKTAEEERTKALDPALSPDPKVARQAMEDAAFTRDRLKTLLPRLQTKHKEVADAEALTAWMAEANELGERRFAMGTEFKTVFSKLIDDIVDRLWEMRDLDRRSLRSTIAAPLMPRTPPVFVFSILSRLHSRNISRSPIPKWAQSIGRTGERDWISVAAASAESGQQMPTPRWRRTRGSFDWRNEAKLDERHRRMLEDNRDKSPRPSSGSASARSAKPPKPARPRRPSELPTMPSTVGRREHRCATPRGCPPWIVLGEWSERLA